MVHPLNNAKITNDSIYYLNNMDPKKSFILTKIHSQDEGVEKNKWLRNNNVKQSVILVPYMLKKVEMVDAKNNILIDDCLNNLREWEQYGGKSILFDIDNDNYDSWHQFNEENYSKTLTLSKFK